MLYSVGARTQVNTHLTTQQISIRSSFISRDVFSLKEKSGASCYHLLPCTKKVQSGIGIAKFTSFFFPRIYCSLCMSVFCIVSVLKKQHLETCFLKMKLYIFKWNVDVFLWMPRLPIRTHTVNPKSKAFMCWEIKEARTNKKQTQICFCLYCSKPLSPVKMGCQQIKPEHIRLNSN